jgi:hypothetical protein
MRPNLIASFLVILLLTARNEHRAVEQPSMCYEIVKIERGNPEQPVLLNKCTGETWIVLKESLAKTENQLTPDYVFKWYFVPKVYTTNDVAGVDK